MNKKHFRVIEQLREMWPSEQWVYRNAENDWCSSEGKRVEPRSLLAPRSPNGDDDHFETRYYRVDEGRYEPLNIVPPTFCLTK